MVSKRRKKHKIIIAVISVVVLVAIFLFPKKMPDHMGSLTEWFVSEPPDVVGQDGVVPVDAKVSADGEQDISKRVKSLEQLDEAKDIVIDGFIKRVKYLPSGSEKPGEFLYKYELETRVEKNSKPELKKIGLVFKDEKMVAQYFEKQSVAQEQMGERFFVRGNLHQSKENTDWLTWMMDVTEVKKWKYEDPCKQYESPNQFKPVEALTDVIAKNKEVSAVIEKTCPNYMSEADSRRDWLLIDPSKPESLTFMFGCDKDLDGQAEGYGIVLDGQEIITEKQSIDSVLPEQADRSACWIKDMDQYFKIKTGR